MLKGLTVVFLPGLSFLSVLTVYFTIHYLRLLLQHWDWMTQLVILRLVSVKPQECIMHHQIAHTHHTGWKAV